jgi:hypothetical protein
MSKKRTKVGKIVVPKHHPVAWQSALWDHLEEIRALRRKRQTWRQIAQQLRDEHRLEISYQAVRNFFVRATAPKRRIPVGLEHVVGATPRRPAAPPPASPVGTGPGTAGSSPQPGDEAFSRWNDQPEESPLDRKLRHLRESTPKEPPQRE